MYHAMVCDDTVRNRSNRNFGNPHWVIYFLKKNQVRKILPIFFGAGSLARFNAGLYAQAICFGAYSGLLFALII